MSFSRWRALAVNARPTSVLYPVGFGIDSFGESVPHVLLIAMLLDTETISWRVDDTPIFGSSSSIEIGLTRALRIEGQPLYDAGLGIIGIHQLRRLVPL